MSDKGTHIAEQPDILAPDAQWRRELDQTFKELIEYLPKIRGILTDVEGFAEDSNLLIEGGNDLMLKVRRVQSEYEEALSRLKQYKVQWNDAISNRSGQLALLDVQRNEGARELANITAMLNERTTGKELVEQVLRDLQKQCDALEQSLKSSQSNESETKLKVQERRKAVEGLEKCHALEVGVFSQQKEERRERAAPKGRDYGTRSRLGATCVGIE